MRISDLSSDVCSSDLLTDRTLPQGVRVITTHHHTVHPHRVHQQSQRTLVEDDGIHVEPSQVVRRRELRRTDDVVAAVPGVFHPSQPETERSPTVRKSDLETTVYQTRKSVH